MPSPFPGMDPYLERPNLWPGLHQTLVTYASAALNAILPPHYIADLGERCYTERPDGNAYPTGAVRAIEPIRVREVFATILPVGHESRIVTVIEVLSPFNKTAGCEGRELYLTRQRELLASRTHLIEIDLLRSGEHTAGPSRARLLERCPWDYVVSLHRGGQENRYEIWGVKVRERLPRILVPLADGDPDVGLDLQAVFDRCYDAGAYARRIDYRRDPPVSLQSDDAQWAAALLRERGLRP